MPTQGPEFTREELEQAITSALSWTEALRNLGYTTSGGNVPTVRKYAARWDIPTDHFDPDLARVRNLRRTKIPLEEVLVRGSTYSRGSLKERLHSEGLKERCCEMCGQGEEWRGARIVPILDHINGDGTDNRIENLRIVCPNCAATLDTHCGKGRRKPPRIRTCPKCEREFEARNREQRYCSRECGQRASGVGLRGVPRPETRKVKRPPYEQLLAEIDATNFSAVGRKYGVSDVAVRKWVRFYERQRELEARRDEDGGGEGERAA